jgi:hypothetical protein
MLMYIKITAFGFIILKAQMFIVCLAFVIFAGAMFALQSQSLGDNVKVTVLVLPFYFEIPNLIIGIRWLGYRCICNLPQVNFFIRVIWIICE